MLSFKLNRILNERTHELDDDVDYIYNKAGYGELVAAVKNQDIQKMRELRNKYFSRRVVIDSSELTNEDSVMAHKKNPIDIYIGGEGGNYYVPSKGYIQLSPRLDVLDLYIRGDVDIYVLSYQKDRFHNEMSEISFKGSIYHELTHWIDDSLYGGFLDKKTKSAYETKSNLPLLGKKTKVSHTFYEVNSQVHAIKQIKRNLGSVEYEKAGWGDLIKLKSSLMVNFGGFKDEKDYDTFMNDFIRRLHRENLLTNKLIKEKPTWKQMKELLDNI